ncbi:cubilin-like, partial [Centruroides sculpturatus]|uniref:cubilin-like n=1 Tax=Centruroides sculpturatus TaxID=218467 RepID=UPI000C6E7151
IFDGDSEGATSLYKICNGVDYPHIILSSKNKLYIKFRTDVSESGRGFKFDYKTNCHNTLTGHRGVIESPNFPSPYPHNYNCSWTIEAPLGNNVSIAFSHLILESHTDCHFDYVEILEKLRDDTEVQIQKYCGLFTTLPSLTSSSHIVIVRFKSDYSISYDGFRLEWKVEGCGGELTRWSDTITTPNYPAYYPLNISCIWYISVPIDKRISIQIQHLELEGAHDCLYDYLKIYGGSDLSAPLLLQLCDTQNNKTIHSQGNHMTLHFSSDYTINGKGFIAHYQAIDGGCGGLYKASSGNIVSPNYPQNYDVSDDCSWLIEVDKNYLIEFTFTEFNMPSSTNCSGSYLAVSKLHSHCKSILFEK